MGDLKQGKRERDEGRELSSEKGKKGGGPPIHCVDGADLWGKKWSDVGHKGERNKGRPDGTCIGQVNQHHPQGTPTWY